MTEDQAIVLFKALADKSRIKILKALDQSPLYVELLAERLNLSASTVSFHLKKLEKAGLVSSKKEQYYITYYLEDNLLKENILNIIKDEAKDIDKQKEREELYRGKVIDSFFEYGKLKSIPVQLKKRRIILEEIAKSFERDRYYSEREVNIIIADIHEDFCTLRRELVAEKLLQRDRDKYWKL